MGFIISHFIWLTYTSIHNSYFCTSIIMFYYQLFNSWLLNKAYINSIKSTFSEQQLTQAPVFNADFDLKHFQFMIDKGFLNYNNKDRAVSFTLLIRLQCCLWGGSCLAIHRFFMKSLVFYRSINFRFLYVFYTPSWESNFLYEIAMQHSYVKDFRHEGRNCDKQNFSQILNQIKLVFRTSFLW